MSQPQIPVDDEALDAHRRTMCANVRVRLEDVRHVRLPAHVGAVRRRWTGHAEPLRIVDYKWRVPQLSPAGRDDQ
jgi:hypothetical protein